MFEEQTNDCLIDRLTNLFKWLSTDPDLARVDLLQFLSEFSVRLKEANHLPHVPLIF